MYVNLDTVINKSTPEVCVNGGCCGGTVLKQQWTDNKRLYSDNNNYLISQASSNKGLQEILSSDETSLISEFDCWMDVMGAIRSPSGGGLQ